MRNKYILYDEVRNRIDAIIISGCSKDYIENVIAGHWDDSWGIIEDLLLEHGIEIIWNDGHPFTFTVDDKVMTDDNTIVWTTV